jgi:NADPH:quinone reductase-like Zn-dependent oxidoreductase
LTWVIPASRRSANRTPRSRQSLFTHGRLTAGQTVLVHGAAGSTGAIAVQLARAAGARVVGTGRTNDEAAARSAGADVFLDLTTRKLSDLGESVDLVFDTIGGDALAASAHVVAEGGAIVSITAPPPRTPAGGGIVEAASQGRCPTWPLRRGYCVKLPTCGGGR